MQSAQQFGMQGMQNLEGLGNKLDVLPKNIEHEVILRACFIAHFVFTSLVYIAPWCPNVYAFYNAFIIAGFWITSSTTQVDASILKMTILEAVSVVLDILMIGLFYNKSTKEGIDFYCFIGFIIHLLIRFGALLGLHRIRKERKGMGLAMPEGKVDYQPVQSSLPPHPQAPAEHVGYDYNAPTKMEGLPDLSRYQQQPRYQ